MRPVRTGDTIAVTLKGPDMTERPRKRRGPLHWLGDRSRRFWIVTALVLPVLYVGMFGPACWCVFWLDSEYGGREGLAEGVAGRIVDSIGLPFAPCGLVAIYGPDFIGLPLRRYAALVVPDSNHFRIPIGFQGWWGLGT